VFRAAGDQVSLRESVLLPEVLRLPAELAKVDALLVDPVYDPVFFAPFAPFFDPRASRPTAATGGTARAWTAPKEPEP
jgi:IS5 family transposase